MKNSFILIITAALYLVFTVGVSPAKDSDIEPILKLDTGGHMALIRDVIVTNDGRYPISASIFGSARGK